MAKESLITDEIRAAMSNVVVSPPQLVEMKAIRDYASAINWPDPPDPLYIDEEYAKSTRFGGIIAPWSFYTSMGRNIRPLRLPLPPYRVSMNGGNDYEYFHPFRPGDVITTTHKIVDVYEEEGRAGRLIFTVTERTYTDQNGEAKGILRHTNIYQY